jgi:hypothetical protein
VRLAAHLERRVGGDPLPGLVEPPLAGEHQARHDHALCGGARLGQAALHKRHVKTGLCPCHGFRHHPALLPCRP